MEKREIQKVSIEQTELVKKEQSFERDTLTEYGFLQNHVLIITGIRRCGKSTVLHQLMQKTEKHFFYINFDDLRLYDFTRRDFSLLDELITESGAEVLFFDEIQTIEAWELYVRQKLDQKFQVVLTGSNASLLSRELGTKLTGRHISKELFPFSFSEFVQFNKMKRSFSAFEEYFKTGGFPEFVKNHNSDILQQLISDILHRDIAVRYGIRDIGSLKNLFIHLLSNAANLVSPSKLIQVTAVKSTSTVLEYLSYLESSYLISVLRKFSFSTKSQMLNPKKIYIGDIGLIYAGSISYSKNIGHIFENCVYNEFRRYTQDIYYFEENGKECDFAVYAHSDKALLVQSCYELTHDNKEREVSGLKAALRFFKQEVGFIITANEKNKIFVDDITIHVVPFYEFDFKGTDEHRVFYS